MTGAQGPVAVGTPPAHQRELGGGQGSGRMYGHAPAKRRSGLTDSLQAYRGQLQQSSSELELREIMQNPASDAPATTFLGVSPPVRSGCFGGAANPLPRNHSWHSVAYSCSHTNLEALRELDLAGEPFLRGRRMGGAPSSSAAELVLGSPDLAMLAEAAAGAGAGGGCMDWSDDGGSDTTTERCCLGRRQHTLLLEPTAAALAGAGALPLALAGGGGGGLPPLYPLPSCDGRAAGYGYLPPHPARC